MRKCGEGLSNGPSAASTRDKAQGLTKGQDLIDILLSCSQPMNILFLCRKRDLGWGQSSFVRALERRGVRVTYVDESTRLDEHIDLRLVTALSRAAVTHCASRA